MNCYPTLTTLSLLTIATGLAIAGPDLIVSDITSATTFGFVDGKMAYSFGTTLCNVGDIPLPWDSSIEEHPLVSQTIYRLADGQLEQLGIGFVRHTTIPLSGNACGLGCTPTGFDALGVGCSDTSSSAIHGSQPRLGPRTEVDPYSGNYQFPFTSLGQSGDSIYKRLRVNLADISDPSALYFVETQVITNGETTDQTRANNVSYRQVVFSPGSASASVVGPTYTEQPAIFAWRDHGHGIGFPDAGVMITQASIPGSGERFVIGSKATSIGIDQWRYDYTVHNQNLVHGISSILIPLGNVQTASGHTFHDVEYHDDVDELIDNTDWTLDTTNGNAMWHIDEDFDTNPLGNAIRWGTMYSFSFISENEPVQKSMELGIFGPGAAGSMRVGIIAPQSGTCIADMNGDPANNFFDISIFLQLYQVDNLNADFTGDGILNFFDISAFLTAFQAGCP